jgi:outer membrane protein insertion porin family
VNGDVDVIFTTREKGRLYLNTSEVGNGEGSAVSLVVCGVVSYRLDSLVIQVTARVRNVFGHAEILEGNLLFGTTTRHSYHALLSAPFTPTVTTRGEVCVPA